MAANEWHYDTAQDLDQSLVARLRRFPREPDMLVYGVRSLATLCLRGWLRAYHRLRLAGREHLPPDSSFVMVANHSSHLDALCLLAALPLRQMHRAFPAAAQDYFFVALPRLAVAAVVVNALPFARQVHVRQSLDLCRQLLATPGNVLILFPEGTRSTSGRMGEFRPGIGALVAGTATPVVPCHIDGAFAAWPKGRIWPRPGPVRVTLGRPRNYAHVTPGREAAARIAADLRQAVEGLAP